MILIFSFMVTNIKISHVNEHNLHSPCDDEDDCSRGKNNKANGTPS